MMEHISVRVRNSSFSLKDYFFGVKDVLLPKINVEDGISHVEVIPYRVCLGG